jgi:nicotinamide-nucleotide amidase
MAAELQNRAQAVGQLLKAKNAVLSTAESCTGGWVSQVITMIPGSSAWFDTGFVTYSNEAKKRLLNVQDATLSEFGAVSEAVVLEMIEGALANSLANTAVAISGVAGPDGGTEAKPVGTVWIAWGYQHFRSARCFLFEGDRESVRLQSVEAALEGIAILLETQPA